MNYEKEIIEKYQNEYLHIQEGNKTNEEKIKKTTRELKETTSFQISRRRRLEAKINEYKMQNKDRNEYLQSFTRKCGLSASFDLKDAERIFKKKEVTYVKMASTIENIREDIKQLTFSYNETITGVKPEISDELTHERSIVRNEMQSLVEDKLKKLYKD